jgi:hypothetical protein
MSTSWTIAGEYIEACYCDFLCPCITVNSTGPAVHDFCKVGVTFRIDDGRFGPTDHAGVCFAVVAESKAVMAEGGLETRSERRYPRQRRAGSGRRGDRERTGGRSAGRVRAADWRVFGQCARAYRLLRGWP